MMRTPKKSLVTPVRSAALLAAVVVGTAGCSSQKKFEVSELCGTTVETMLVAPFVPEGDTLKIDDSLSGPGQPRCQVYVDGKLSLYVRGDIVEPDFDPLKATERSMRRLGEPSPADVGDGAVIADHGAMAVQACTHKGVKSQYVLDIDGVENPKGTAERRKALEKLLRAYLPVAMKAEDCRP
ncbi:hypothetical protein ACOZFM_15645 [Streptomyces arboris]|uniref:hypothetical protein n=1 Tax=Streptomyces arboris TaxID=2600619 RepID=UPI003BF4769E